LYNLYQAPTDAFVVFEHVPFNMFTSDQINNNHYVILLPQEWLYGMNLFFKNEINYHLNFLVENSAIDTLNYIDFWSNLIELNSTPRILVYYILYFYTLKSRFTLFVYNHENSFVESLEKIYKNALWLERESSEMYGINYRNKSDNRSLLLDYSRNENPMLKDFPTEGWEDIFYDFFEHKLTYSKHYFTEL